MKTTYKIIDAPKVGEVVEYSVLDCGVWWDCKINYVVGGEGVVLFAPHLGMEMYFDYEEISLRKPAKGEQTLMDYLETKYSLQGDEKTKLVLWEMSKDGLFSKLIEEKNLLPF